MSVYDSITNDYLNDLRVARDEALAWWDRLLKDSAPDGDMLAAERRVRPRWPAGAVSHPRVIAVYRYYFLMLDKLNDERHAAYEMGGPSRDEGIGWGEEDEEEWDGIVEPRFLLLDTLEAVAPELAEFMSRFVFCAIGADPDDETA